MAKSTKPVESNKNQTLESMLLLVEKRVKQFNRMRSALKIISDGLMGVDMLKENTGPFEYLPALEERYEDMQELARRAVRGVKEIKEGA